jgi:hypothetical protein
MGEQYVLNSVGGVPLTEATLPSAAYNTIVGYYNHRYNNSVYASNIILTVNPSTHPNNTCSNPTEESYRSRNNTNISRQVESAKLTSIIASIKRLAAFLIVITVSAVGAIYVFDLFVAQPINLPTLLQQSFDIIIIVAFWLTAIFLLLKTKKSLTPHVGFGSNSASIRKH